jgi:hypothetical protein
VNYGLVKIRGAKNWANGLILESIDKGGRFYATTM